MENKIFEQVNVKEEIPAFFGWFNTDRGLLCWWPNEEEWSCNEDRMSEEYPKYWYKEVK